MASARSAECCIRSHGARELGREFRDCRPPEETRHFEIRPRGRVEAAHELRAPQRIAAKLEEVVEGADRTHTQHFREEAGNLFLATVARRRERRPQARSHESCDRGALEFSGDGARQSSVEHDLARHHERREVGEREITQRLGRRSARFAEDDGGDHVLAERCVRHREGGRIGNFGMPQERRIHRGRGHLEAAAIDELFRAPDDEKIAVAIDIAEIARPEPAFEKRAPVRGRIALVAVEDLRSAHDDLACLARWQQRAGIAQDRELVGCGQADRAGATYARRQRILGDDAGLRHSVSLQQRHAQPLCEACSQFRRQRGGRRKNESQREPGNGIAPRKLVQQRAVDGRSAAVVRRLERLEPFDHRIPGNARRAYDAAARGERREEAPPNASRREERPHAQATIGRRQAVLACTIQRRAYESAMRERNRFRPLRRAGRVQHERDVVARGSLLCSCRARRSRFKREHASGISQRKHKANRRHRQRRGRARRRRVFASDNHRVGAKRRKRDPIRRLVQCGIERHAGGAPAHGEYRDRHLRAVGQRQCNAVPASETGAGEAVNCRVDGASQRPERERRPSRRQDRESVGRDERFDPDDVGDGGGKAFQFVSAPRASRR